MYEEIRSWPWGWAWLTLYAIVFCRAGLTYGLGRAVAAGIRAKRESGPRMRAAMYQVDKYGPWAVAASFVTVGIQSVVNGAAGLLAMPIPRYLVGLIPGAAIWATIWLTVGFAAIFAVFSLSPAQGTAVILLVCAVIGFIVYRRRTVSR